MFDARWEIPNVDGTYYNVFPRAIKGAAQTRIYRALIQSGGESGITTNHYPLKISWNVKDVPAKTDTNNPAGSAWYIQDRQSKGNTFGFNMRTGAGQSTVDIPAKLSGDIFTITVYRTTIDGFFIVHDWISDVKPPVDGYTTGLNSVSPNPFGSNTNITFSLNRNERVRLEIIDELGKLVNVLDDQDYPAGQYSLNWNGADMSGLALPSGNYTCRMVAGSATSTQRVVIIR